MPNILWLPAVSAVNLTRVSKLCALHMQWTHTVGLTSLVVLEFYFFFLTWNFGTDADTTHHQACSRFWYKAQTLYRQLDNQFLPFCFPLNQWRAQRWKGNAHLHQSYFFLRTNINTPKLLLGEEIHMPPPVYIHAFNEPTTTTPICKICDLPTAHL